MAATPRPETNAVAIGGDTGPVASCSPPYLRCGSPMVDPQARRASSCSRLESTATQSRIVAYSHQSSTANSAARAALGHQGRHRLGTLAAAAQARDHAGAVLLRPVLADLPLAFDARDRNFHADDAFDLRRDIR